MDPLRCRYRRDRGHVAPRDIRIFELASPSIGQSGYALGCNSGWSNESFGSIHRMGCAKRLCYILDQSDGSHFHLHIHNNTLVDGLEAELPKKEEEIRNAI